MFNNIGEKIKGVAIFLFILEIIVFAVLGVVIMTNGGPYIPIGFAVVVVGVIVAFLSVMILFAYGQITSNTDKLVEIGKLQTKILLNQTDIMAEVEDEENEDKSVFATSEAKDVIDFTEVGKEISDLDLYMLARRDEAEQNGEVEIEPIEDEDDDDDDE